MQPSFALFFHLIALVIFPAAGAEQTKQNKMTGLFYLCHSLPATTHISNRLNQFRALAHFQFLNFTLFPNLNFLTEYEVFGQCLP